MKRSTLQDACLRFAPILILAAWVAWLEFEQKSGVLVELAIQGYDPRDQLRGHYVVFSIDRKNLNPCTPSIEDQEACLCLSQDFERRFSPSWAGACQGRPQECKVFLKGSCEGERFSFEVMRYYIPEADSAYLTTVPPNSSVLMSVNSSGIARVLSLKPEGLDYDVWIRARKAKSR